MLKFISLLGTNKYIPCNYYLNDSKVEDCCYIQHALLGILKNQGMIPDKAIIFTTKLAEEVNWENNNYNNERLGLKDELNNIDKSGSCKVENVPIPDGHSEEELWIIFERIFNEIKDGDEIILDITHSFRYLPMLTFIIINYARVVKNCSLKAIYYGAFEVLGSYKKVPKIPLEERNAPIFDLTPFVTLFDWTIGVDRYLATGDVSIISNLTEAEAIKIREAANLNTKNISSNKDKALLFKDSNALKRLAGAMINFSDVVFTCRGQEITKRVSWLKENIDSVIRDATHEKVRPLVYLMEMLQNRFNKFSFNDDYVNVIETTKWCLENEMYQQGFTILQEGLITYVCEKWNLDKTNEQHRNIVTSYAYKVTEGNMDVQLIPLNIGRENAKELFKLIHSISSVRNDINHGGWRPNPMDKSKFKDNLEKYTKEVEAFIVNDLGKNMLLVFSHEITKKQKEEAKERFGTNNFIGLNDELLKKWSNVPPNLKGLEKYLEDIIEWIKENSKEGDYVLVQGDYGATIYVVNYCIEEGLVPVYATTKRKVVEKKVGEKVKLSREFEHVMFRKY